MSTRAHERHVLSAIEASLASSDPRLRSKLAMFNRLSAGEAFPGLEQIRRGHRYRDLAWPALWLAICTALLIAALVVAHTGGPAA